MKRKVITLDCVRDVCFSDGNEIIHRGVKTKEAIEINSDIINVYTANEKIVGNEIVADIKFIVRGGISSETKTLSLSVHCTMEQATKNIELIAKILEEFRVEEAIENEKTKQVQPKLELQDADEMEQS